MKSTQERLVPSVRTGPPAEATRPRRRRRRPGARSDRLAAFAFLTPNVIAYTMFIAVPAFTGVALSFYSWDLFGSPEWVGLKNYQRLLHDPRVGGALINSGKFLALGVIPTILLGFLFAILINWQARMIGVIRLMYFLPLVISTAVAGVLWSTLFSPSYGMINRILQLLHVPQPQWLASTTWALPALTIVIIWLSLPLVTILYLAGLQRVPPQIYEAAQIDGANLWTRIWSITWPSVATTTALVAGLEILQFLAAPFEVALIMTGDGSPLNSTESMSLYAYKIAFIKREIGYASALSMLQFFVLLAIVGIVFLVRRQRRHA